MEIAKEIRRQIGNRAFFMMGGKNLIASEDALTWKIGRNAKNVTHVTVTLDPSDTYTIKFQRVHGLKVTDKGELSMVYADQLHALIEENTGLYLSL